MGKPILNLSTVTRVGLDLAKRVFQVHAVDAKGEIVVARKLTRSQLIPFFRQAAAVRGGDGGVLFGASLGAAAHLFVVLLAIAPLLKVQASGKPRAIHRGLRARREPATI